MLAIFRCTFSEMKKVMLLNNVQKQHRSAPFSCAQVVNVLRYSSEFERFFRFPRFPHKVSRMSRITLDSRNLIASSRSSRNNPLRPLLLRDYLVTTSLHRTSITTVFILLFIYLILSICSRFTRKSEQNIFAQFLLQR